MNKFIQRILYNEKERKLFEPVRVKRSTFKSVIMGMAAFLIIFAVVAAFYLSKTGRLGASDDESKSSETEIAPAPNFISREAYRKANVNILLMSASSSITTETGDREIYFIMIAHADAYTGQVKLCPLVIKQSYIDLYNEGGCYSVTKAIAAEYKIKLEKYICSNENTFALAINNMGGYEYNIPERLEYRTKDFTLILTPGKQTLKGESLIKYIQYLNNTDLAERNKILCDFISSCLNQENFDNAMDIYKKTLSSLLGNTNISFYDAADNLKYVRPIIERKKAKVITVSSVGEF